MRQLKLLTVLLAALFFIFGCASNDSQKTEGTSEEPAEANTEEVGESWQREGDEDHRIISTTVAIAEIMEQLELDLVGIPTSYKELAPQYQDLPEVGLADEPDMEIVRSLNPTDVLSVTTLQSDVEEYYKQADTPITFLDLESVDGMLESIELLGEKYNRVDEAKAMVEKFEQQMKEIEEEIADKESPEVLILLGIPGSYLVATENSYLGDLAKRAGARNVFPGEDDVEYASANTEYLQQTNPDVILRAAHGMPEAVVEMFDKEFAENDVWKHFDAVENGRVYDLEETLFGTTANLAAHEALMHLLDILYEE